MESSQLHNILPTCAWTTPFCLDMAIWVALGMVWDRVRATVIPFPKSISQYVLLMIKFGDINDECTTFSDVNRPYLTNFAWTEGEI